MKKHENNVPVWLMIFFGCFILCGRILILFGFGGQLKQSSDVAGFQQTVGHFTDYFPDRSNTDKPTYFLVYSYDVDGKNYTATTDYSTGLIPRNGSSAKIKFNPTDPTNRVIQNANENYTLIFIGIIFTVIPGFLLYTIAKQFKTEEKTGRVNATAFFVSLITIFISFSGMCMIVGTADLAEIFKFYRNYFSFTARIPLIMMFFGVVGCLSAITRKSKESKDNR